MSIENKEIKEIRKNFKEFYKENLKGSFKDVERLRLKYLMFFYTYFAVMFVFGGGAIFINYSKIQAFLQNYFPNGDPTGFLVLIYVVISYIIVSSPVKVYRAASKSKIMPDFIKFFDDAVYGYENQIGRRTLLQSKIISKYNNVSTDDYIKINYKGYKIQTTELILSKKQKDPKQGGNTIVFDGVLVAIKMKKPFKGHTVGVTDKGFFNLPNFFGLTNIKLEDISFEKEWEVYSDNQSEAKSILTTAFLEKLLKIKEKYHSNSISFSLFDDTVLFKLKPLEDMFETSSLFKSAKDTTKIIQAFEQMLSLIAVVEILKQNKKI